MYSISSVMEYNFKITNIFLFTTKVWCNNRRVKWRKEVRFAKRL